MKNLSKLLIAFLIITLFSCKKDECTECIRVKRTGTTIPTQQIQWTEEKDTVIYCDTSLIPTETENGFNHTDTLFTEWYINTVCE